MRAMHEGHYSMRWTHYRYNTHLTVSLIPPARQTCKHKSPDLIENGAVLRCTAVHTLALDLPLRIFLLPMRYILLIWRTLALHY